MADNFIGRRVWVQLKDGSTAEGTLSDINAETGTMMLYQSQLTRVDGRVVTLSAYAANRQDIANVKILGQQKHAVKKESSHVPTDESSVTDNEVLQAAASSSSRRHQPDPPAKSSQPPRSGQNGSSHPASQGKGKKKNGTNGNQARFQDPPEQQQPPRPQSASSSFKKSPAKSNGAYARAESPARPASASYVDKDGHFDFSKGLLQFDKKKVFQEIRDSDQSDPANLLVSHNKRTQGNERYTTKLLPSENVLDDGERQAEALTVENAIHDRAQASQRQQPVTSSDETPDSSLPGGITADISASSGGGRAPDSKSTDGGKSHLDQKPLFRTLDGDVICPALSVGEYKELVKVANTETGPNATQRIENGARGIAQYILQTIASPKRGFFTSSRPSSLTVVILVGACSKGQYGLRTGSHLANKGVNVIAWLPSQPANLDVSVRMLEASGGRMMQHVADLPSTPSLIIDALSDSNEDVNSFKVKRKAVPGEGEAVLYANSHTGAPTLAIDAPSFLNLDDGASVSSYNAHARFSVALGALRPIHQIPRLIGEVAIVDIGLPLSAYKRVQEDWPEELWGSEWVVSCIRA